MGDVIGVLVQLGDVDKLGKIPVQYLKKIPVRMGSFIAFYKNGVHQGTAFRPLLQNTYYPCVSLFGGASVTANFGGTEFSYPPSGVLFSLIGADAELDCKDVAV